MTILTYILILIITLGLVLYWSRDIIASTEFEATKKEIEQRVAAEKFQIDMEMKRREEEKKEIEAIGDKDNDAKTAIAERADVLGLRTEP